MAQAQAEAEAAAAAAGLSASRSPDGEEGGGVRGLLPPAGMAAWMEWGEVVVALGGFLYPYQWFRLSSRPLPPPPASLNSALPFLICNPLSTYLSLSEDPSRNPTY